jgi:hypothetical protein
MIWPQRKKHGSVVCGTRAELGTGKRNCYRTGNLNKEMNGMTTNDKIEEPKKKKNQSVNDKIRVFVTMT